MSTAERGKPAKQRSSLSRVLLWLVLSIVIIVAGLSGYAYYVAYSALPQLDGQLRLPGLSRPVKVTRGDHGVPTIEAATVEDLFFAQGFVTAQDRLWQMDMTRRYASGELSEILGEDLVRVDREQRVLGLLVTAKKSLGMASARDRTIFEAYARGVNAYIAAQGTHLPIEFKILGYAPTPWLAEDSLVIANQMAKDLNYSLTFYHPLDREKILAKLGPELTADLYVNRSQHDRPPTEGGKDQKQAPTASYDAPHDDSVIGRSTLEMMDSQAVNGSNEWVVSGVHTYTGKPLLSNDMHLGHQMPNLWYEAHLHSGSLDVVGVTLPGMPCVIVGHNQRVAWGFTNVGPTVTDLYIENFNPEGSYKTPKGWVRPEHRTETIHVKGKPDVVVDVKVTRHGPIVTELIPGEFR
jgi:penicillin amidase